MSPEKTLQKDTRRQIQAMADEYGVETIPVNVDACLEAIPNDPNPGAKAAAALRKMEVRCLAAWARGEVAGPDSIESLERRAKQAESLAKMLANKGNQAAATKQLKRAKDFRKQAVSMAALKESK